MARFSSPGSAAAEGLAQGFSMGQQVIENRDRAAARGLQLQEREADRAIQAEDRAYQRQRTEAADARLVQQDQRQLEADARTQGLDELKLIDTEVAELKAQGDALFTQYGGFDKVPPQARQQFVERERDLRERRGEARRKFTEPKVAAQRQRVQEIASKLQAGRMRYDDLDPGSKYELIAVTTRRPPEQFYRGPNGEPSDIDRAIEDAEVGMQTGNNALLFRGLNVAYAPEIKRGIGEPGRDGNIIVDKELYQLVPHPRDPGLLVPILKVTVQRPDGARGTYKAPVTEGRSSDPDELPKAISVEKGLERLGQLGVMGEAVNAPGARKELEAGAQAKKGDVDEFLGALGYLGVKAPVRKVTRDKLELGNRVIDRELDETGRVVSERSYAKGAAPRAAGSGRGRVTGLALTLQTIDDEVDAGTLEEGEAEDLKRDAIRRAARGAGSGGSADKTAEKGKEKVADASEALNLIDDARAVLNEGATGSGLGKGLDELGRFFGYSTKGAGLGAKLKALEGALVAKMPKMSGPQSDRDVQLYRQQAGLIGDETIPVETRLAALDAIEEIQRRYAQVDGNTGGADGDWREPGGLRERGSSSARAPEQPRRLSTDQAKAAAEFDALPSGALFQVPGEPKPRRKP